MKTTALLSLSLLCLAACGYHPREVAAPATFTQAELTPARPTDTAHPLAAVIWTLNYDLNQFDAVWKWVRDDVPHGAERSRALAAASLIAVAELDRTDLRDEGLAAFDEAIPLLPDDARLPLWRAYIVFLKARDAHDAPAITAALDEIRAATNSYQAFTLFGITLAVGGLEDASPALIDEAQVAYTTVITDTTRMQHATAGLDRERTRRIWDTPIAPYNIPAMQAMIGDLALRAGKKDEAQRAYFTALNANNAARWPWRGEVQRRLEHADDVAAGLTAHPATEWTIGSRGKSAMGMATAAPDNRFGGRVGNGSCTVCHSHVSAFDLNETAAQVGWVKVKVQMPAEVPNLQGVAFLLPNGQDVIPGGFAIGPFVDAAAPRDFDTRDELYESTMVIPAAPGTYFVAVQDTIDGKPYQGYLPREMGMQWWLDVKPGVMLDVTEVPIQMKPLETK